MFEARAAHARAAKQARLQENEAATSTEVGDATEESAPGRSEIEDPDMSSDEESEGRAQSSDSENDRGDNSSSDDDSEFNDDKAQDIFDDWIISLSIPNRKMLSVLLFHSFRIRQKNECHRCRTRVSFHHWIQ